MRRAKKSVCHYQFTKTLRPVDFLVEAQRGLYLKRHNIKALFLHARSDLHGGKSADSDPFAVAYTKTYNRSEDSHIPLKILHTEEK